MSKKAKQVYIAVPGQGVGQGGIVRQMQYLMQEAEKYPDSPAQFHWLATHNNKQSWPLFFAIKLVRTLILLLMGKVDLLYLNLASKGSFWRKYTLSRMVRLFGVPFLIHLHGGGFQQFYQESSDATKLKIRNFFRQASAIIVLGQEWKNFAESLGAAPDDVTILYNSVPKPAPYEKVENDVPQLVFLGHLVERKGVRELLDALAMLKDESWQATIAGSGQLEQFKAQAEALGLQERVFFPGWLDEHGVIDLYKKADVLVLPSYVENQPMCILEAISYKLAIIATAVGTVPEMLTDGEDALIIPPQDAQALADAMQTLLQDKELRRKLTEKASPIQSVRHSMDAYYFLIESLILRL